MTKIVGFKHVDFTDDNGKHVVGDKIWITDDSNSSVTGVTTDTAWLTQGKVDFTIELGQQIDIRYNKFGKIDRVSLVKGGKF